MTFMERDDKDVQANQSKSKLGSFSQLKKIVVEIEFYPPPFKSETKVKHHRNIFDKANFIFLSLSLSPLKFFTSHNFKLITDGT